MKASQQLGGPTARHLAEAFELVARSRFTNRHYDRARNVPSPVIRRILELGQLAPTSFNLQPFQYVLIRSPEAKDLLASSMIGNNARVVADTSFSIAFLAENGECLKESL
jgi:nitroreductase